VTAASYLDDLTERLIPVVRDMGLVHGEPTAIHVLLSLAGGVLALWIGLVIATRIFSPASSAQSMGTAVAWAAAMLVVDAATQSFPLQSVGQRGVVAAALLLVLCAVTRFTLSTTFAKAALIVTAGLLFGGVAGVLLALGLRLINAI
jgi:hypothetical protein